MRWLPESRVGWWAVALAGLTVAGVVLIALAFALGVVEPADSFTDNWVLTVGGLAIWASGVSCVVAGAVATIRRHERSWMVLVATLLGLLPAALLLSEVAQGKV
jgi:hypothetical protein